MIVSLPELKVHLKVDHDDQDMEIQGFSDAAEAIIQNWLGRKVYASEDEMPVPPDAAYDPHQMVADGAIRVAIKQMVGRFFGPQRSGEGGTDEDAVPPLSVRALLAGYRIFCPDPYDPEQVSDAESG